MIKVTATFDEGRKTVTFVPLNQESMDEIVYCICKQHEDALFIDVDQDGEQTTWVASLSFDPETNTETLKLESGLTEEDLQ